jgi:hypothetical protein
VLSSSVKHLEQKLEFNLLLHLEHLTEHCSPIEYTLQQHLHSQQLEKMMLMVYQWYFIFAQIISYNNIFNHVFYI